MRKSLSRRLPVKELLLLGPIPGNGLRSTHLSGKPPGHRSVPTVDERQALPYGIPRKGSTLDACSSCQAKRSVLFAEKLVTEVLAPVPHRHWSFSIPRVLRGLVERDRKLLGLLSQTAYAAILKTFQALFDRADVRPGCVVSLQTFGAYGANFHPHAHALVSV